MAHLHEKDKKQELSRVREVAHGAERIVAPFEVCPLCERRLLDKKFMDTWKQLLATSYEVEAAWFSKEMLDIFRHGPAGEDNFGARGVRARTFGLASASAVKRKCSSHW